MRWSGSGVDKRPLPLDTAHQFVERVTPRRSPAPFHSALFRQLTKHSQCSRESGTGKVKEVSNPCNLSTHSRSSVEDRRGFLRRGRIVVSGGGSGMQAKHSTSPRQQSALLFSVTVNRAASDLARLSSAASFGSVTVSRGRPCSSRSRQSARRALNSLAFCSAPFVG